MRFVVSALLALSVLLPSARAQRRAPAAANALTVQFIDVEGGQATLFSAPGAESLLVDTGWDANNGRDADRIAAAAHNVGLQRIDYVLITHFHADHVGGLRQLMQRIPVGAVLDHGPNRELDKGKVEALYSGYQSLLASSHLKHITLHPGERLPVRGLDGVVLSGDGRTLEKPLPGAGERNPFCPAEPLAADTTENSRSLGFLLTYGRFRLLDLGDLTRDKEQQLMCPVDRVGKVDVLVVSHHGWNQSSSQALVYAVSPVVAIMDNGATKGGSTEVLDIVRHSPGLQALYQLHYSEEGGEAHNTQAPLIANPHGPDAGHSLVLTVHSNGSFQVLNTRTGHAQPYQSASHPGVAAGR